MLTLFNIVINDLVVGKECMLNKFVGDTKLQGRADLLVEGSAFQGDLDKIEELAY